MVRTITVDVGMGIEGDGEGEVVSVEDGDGEVVSVGDGEGVSMGDGEGEVVSVRLWLGVGASWALAIEVPPTAPSSCERTIASGTTSETNR